MTKAVEQDEPYTGEEFERVLAESGQYHLTPLERRLLATIEAERTARVDAEQEAAIMYGRAEAADARIAELEKERTRDLNSADYWERRAREFFSDWPTPPVKGD